MRHRRALLPLSAVGVVAALMVAAGAGAAGSTAVIKTKGGEHWAANRSDPPNMVDVDTLQWAPGTMTVHSGQKIRIVIGERSHEPHVLAIALKKDLPGLRTNPATNPVLRMIAPKLLKDPANPQSGFKAFKASAGKNGLNQEGDALVVVPGTPHKAASWFVSAKPGTTLYYFCAVHFWMRGALKVVK